MKKLATLLLTFCLLLAAFGCPTVLAATADLPVITVEHTARRTYALSAGVSGSEADYTFIAASYRSDKTLVGVELIPATVEAGTATATAAVDDAAYAEETATTSFMLWNMDDFKPLAQVAEKSYAEATDVASGKSVYGNGSANNGLITYTATALTDGNEETNTGFYASLGTQGYMYLNLGSRYIIDRIEVLGYTNNADYPQRGGHYDVLVSNTKPTLAPTNGAFEEGAQAGETVVATREETAIVNGNFRQTFGMPTGSGAYQYVSLEKLFETAGDYTNWEGLLIAEVKVYVLNEDIVEYTEVANGKTTGGANYYPTNAAWEGLMSPAGALVDGAEDGSAGFYYSRFQGYMYIDLGMPYEIDHIEFLAYNAVSYNRAGNFNIVAGNTKPDNVAYNAENPGDEILVASVPADAAASSAAVGYKTIYMPEDSGSYRYVSFEKFQENSDGLLIQEVKVYVRNDKMPSYSFVNVAEGKSTGGQNYTNSSWSNLMYSAGALVDGAEDGIAGFYVSIYRGYMYIDLGMPYEIDHIDVLAYNSVNTARCGDYNIVAGNTVPDNVAYDSQNTTGEILVAQVPADSAATSSAVGYKRFDMPGDGNKYQYISFEKLQENSVGLVMQEVKIYVRSDKMPSPEELPATDVARGLTEADWTIAGGGLSADYKNLNKLTDGVAAAAFGDAIAAARPSLLVLDLGASYDLEKVVLGVGDRDATRTNSMGITVSIGNTAVTSDTEYTAAEKTTVLATGTTALTELKKTVELATPVNARYIYIQVASKADSGTTEDYAWISEIEAWGK